MIYKITFVDKSTVEVRGIAEITDNGCLYVFNSDGIIIGINYNHWIKIEEVE